MELAPQPPSGGKEVSSCVSVALSHSSNCVGPFSCLDKFWLVRWRRLRNASQMLQMARPRAMYLLLIDLGTFVACGTLPHIAIIRDTANASASNVFYGADRRALSGSDCFVFINCHSFLEVLHSCLLALGVFVVLRNLPFAECLEVSSSHFCGSQRFIFGTSKHFMLLFRVQNREEKLPRDVGNFLKAALFQIYPCCAGTSYTGAAVAFSTPDDRDIEPLVFPGLEDIANGPKIL